MSSSSSYFIKFSLLITLIILTSATSTWSQDIGFYKWLCEKSVDQVIIELQWDSLSENRNSDKEWEASFLCIDTNSDTTKFKAEISARGKYRRRICDLPPFKADIKKKSLRKRGIDDDIDEYKIVYNCDQSYRREQLIETEGLIYNLYNRLDSNSLGIKEITLRILDIGGKTIWDGPAFIIESDKELAKRKKFEILKEFGHQDSIGLDKLYRLALFQFLICNHDWNIDMLKNVELFKDENGEYLAVPYDFDFSGWVEAPYWVGRTDLGLNYPLDRYLFLDDPDFGILDKEWKRFVRLRSTFESMVNEHPSLRRSQKRKILKSIDSFYKLYADIVKGERKFLQY